jgi:serine O-acetyltransferase
MKREIEADLYRYGGLTGRKGFWRAFFLAPGFRYMYFFRKVSEYRPKSLRWYFFNFFKRRYRFKYGYQIPANTDIGEGFYIGHTGTIVINGKAKIGSNCNIAHNVTIGQANRGNKKGVPVIGDNVWMGTGSVIVGAIKIGSNVLIAPNSFVNIDIPGNSLVIGNPCKIIAKENPCDGYLNFVFEK